VPPSRFQLAPLVALGARLEMFRECVQDLNP